MKIVVVQAGDGRYGIPVQQVQSIERVLPIRPVPGVAAHILGVTNLRGSVIAVQDLRRLLGEKETGVTDDSRLLVTHGSGCLVDAALDIVEVDDQAIETVGETAQRVWNRDGRELIVLTDLPGHEPHEQAGA